MSDATLEKQENAEYLRSVWRRLSPVWVTEVVWNKTGLFADPLSWPEYLSGPDGRLDFEMRGGPCDPSEYDYDEDEDTEEGATRGVEVSFGPQQVSWDDEDEKLWTLTLRVSGASYGEDDHLPLTRVQVQALSFDELTEALSDNRRALQKPGLEDLFSGYGHEVFSENTAEGALQLGGYCCLIWNQMHLVGEYFRRLSQQKAPKGATWAVWDCEDFTITKLQGFLDDSFDYETRHSVDDEELPWVFRYKRPWPNPEKLNVARPLYGPWSNPNFQPSADDQPDFPFIRL